MVLVSSLKLDTKEPPQQTLTQSTFQKGVITLIDQSKIPKNALVQADNIMLYEDGAPGPRWGTNWYGNALPNGAAIDGAFMYVDSSKVSHLVVIGGGTVYRSLNDGVTWTACTGATLTTGAKVIGVQANGFETMVDGVDSIIRYNGTTTLQVYTSLGTPGSISITKTGLTGTSNYTYYYRFAAVNGIGVGISSSSSAGTITVDRPRTSFDATDFLSLTGSVPTGATAINVYVGTQPGNEAYLDSIAVASGATTFTYKDNANIPVASANVLAPNVNTTQGPVLTQIKYVGDRLWGIGADGIIYWTGSGPFVGYFANATYDGGYIQINVGSQYHAVDLEDYRDGKGTPYTTVWFNSSDGIGSVWQISLTTQTIQNVYSYTSPSAFKVPGSRGTPAPLSVVNVLNDFMYLNSQAFYNLGSRAQFLNLLSTDEISVNIRPSVRQINPAAEQLACSFFFLDKVFFSVATGTSTVNNSVIVYDTERQCWLPTCFTYGVERFFQYSDNQGPANGQGTTHLLMWKPGDNRLSEINQNFAGDYGQPFQTKLLTGLIPVSSNRFDFMFLSETDLEFSQPKGAVNFQLIGIDRNYGYRTLYSGVVNTQVTTSSTGWSTFAWSTEPWTYTPAGAVASYSTPSSKNYFFSPVEVNAYQFSLTTNTIDANYILRTLQVTGSLTNTGPPRAWRVQAQTNN